MSNSWRDRGYPVHSYETGIKYGLTPLEKKVQDHINECMREGVQPLYTTVGEYKRYREYLRSDEFNEPFYDAVSDGVKVVGAAALGGLILGALFSIFDS